jgi:hypothetical protein
MMGQLDRDLKQCSCIGVVVVVDMLMVVLVRLIVIVSIDSIGAVGDIGRCGSVFQLLGRFCTTKSAKLVACYSRHLPGLVFASPFMTV